MGGGLPGFRKIVRTIKNFAPPHLTMRTKISSPLEVCTLKFCPSNDQP